MTQILNLYRSLLSKHGPQGWWPVKGIYDKENNHSRVLSEQDRFEICLGAILTQNTAWKNVEKALGELRRKNALSKKALRGLHSEKIAEMIKSSGYHNQKARKIKEFIKFLDSGKQITLKNRADLLKVWGIGPETADSILLYACNEPVFVVDAYTRRVMEKEGIIDGKNINNKNVNNKSNGKNRKMSYEELQELITHGLSNVKKEDKVRVFNEFHALLVEEGKSIR